MKAKLGSYLSFWAFLVLATVAGWSTTSAGPAPAGEHEYVEMLGVQEFSGRLIARPVQPKAWKAKGLSRVQALDRVVAARALLERHRILDFVFQTDEYIIEVPAGKTENAMISSLKASGLLEYVEPDWIVYPISAPDDTLYGDQWHHDPDRMQSADGWDIHTGNSSVSVGICDTGVLTSHEDLQLHRLEGYNAVDKLWESQGGNIGPVHPHGTMTTGSAAANGNNYLGVAGVGWNLSHRMLRVSNSGSGDASISDLQHAARTAVENGDMVASVSYTGVDCCESNLTTATYIKSIGGLLVWAAGNDNRNLTLGNRDADDIIVVGGTDWGDNKASSSAYGPFVDLTAPAVGIYTTDSGSDNDYASVSGTSFSAPLTAGLAALIWSYDPSLTPDEVEAMLKQGSDDLGAVGVDDTFGYGRINVYGALSLVNAPPPPDTIPPDAPTGLGAVPGDGSVDLDWDDNTEPDLAGYSVYRSTTSGGPYSLITGSLPASAYIDNPLTNGTTYYYVVTASDTSGNESGDSNEASATPSGPGLTEVAIAESSIYGTVIGTYQATHSQNDAYQSITEEHSGGKLEIRHDLLQHRWTFNVTSGYQVFSVDAYREEGGDADSGFNFFWSQSSDGPWTPLLAVTKMSDDDIYQTADLGEVSGTVYIQAVDNNRETGNKSYDTLHVDHMFIDGGSPPIPPTAATVPNPTIGATGVDLSPTLSWTAGTGAASHNVYFGTNPTPGSGEDQGNQMAITFSPGQLSAKTIYYWRIDEVNAAGTTIGTIWQFTTTTAPMTMHVDSIVPTTVSVGINAKGRATVTIVDDLGNFVQGATVTGTFTESYNETQTGVTDTDGVAVLTTAEKVKGTILFEFCVDNVTGTLPYDAGDNFETCKTN